MSSVMRGVETGTSGVPKTRWKKLKRANCALLLSAFFTVRVSFGGASVIGPRRKWLRPDNFLKHNGGSDSSKAARPSSASPASAAAPESTFYREPSYRDPSHFPLAPSLVGEIQKIRFASGKSAGMKNTFPTDIRCANLARSSGSKETGLLQNSKEASLQRSSTQVAQRISARLPIVELTPRTAAQSAAPGNGQEEWARKTDDQKPAPAKQSTVFRNPLSKAAHSQSNSRHNASFHFPEEKKAPKDIGGMQDGRRDVASDRLLRDSTSRRANQVQATAKGQRKEAGLGTLGSEEMEKVNGKDKTRMLGNNGAKAIEEAVPRESKSALVNTKSSLESIVREEDHESQKVIPLLCNEGEQRRARIDREAGVNSESSFSAESNAEQEETQSIKAMPVRMEYEADSFGISSLSSSPSFSLHASRVWPGVPRPKMHGMSLGILQWRNDPIRHKLAHTERTPKQIVEDTHTEEEETCERGICAAGKVSRGVKSRKIRPSENEEETSTGYWYRARPLPDTSEVTASANALLRKQEATTENKNVSPAKEAAAGAGVISRLVGPRAKQENLTGSDKKARPPARTSFHAWSSLIAPGFRKSLAVDRAKAKAELVGFPFSRLSNVFSMPWVTSDSTRCCTGSDGDTKTELSTATESTEALARYAEPDDEDQVRDLYSKISASETMTQEDGFASVHTAEEATGSKSTREERSDSFKEAHTNAIAEHGKALTTGKPPEQESHAVLRNCGKVCEVVNEHGCAGQSKLACNEGQGKLEELKHVRNTREKAHMLFTGAAVGEASASQLLPKVRFHKEEKDLNTGDMRVDRELPAPLRDGIDIESQTVAQEKGTEQSNVTGRLFVSIPPREELEVDLKARTRLGNRAHYLRQSPLIEKSSTECLGVLTDRLTNGTIVVLEPRGDIPEADTFKPIQLEWGDPLGAGANGVVFEVTATTTEGKKLRYALKLLLNRHIDLCNTWTRGKRGELTSSEILAFEEDVQRMGQLEYNLEMEQRRLLSLARPAPLDFSYEGDAGKLFAEHQVCAPLAVGRIRELPEYMVCPGGNIAIVNVAGIMPAASCNLYQLLETYDLSLSEKYELTRQVITAVGSLHNLGLLHKDLKSENFLVTSKGTVLIADLAGVEPLRVDATESAGHFDPGTITFIAPERAAARLGRPGMSNKITVRANAWSLGMTIYEIWCRGRDPFPLDALTDAEVLRHLDGMLQKGLRITFKLCPSTPKRVKHLIKSLLQPDPQKRKTAGYLMWSHSIVRKAELITRALRRAGRTSHA